MRNYLSKALMALLAPPLLLVAACSGGSPNTASPSTTVPATATTTAPTQVASPSKTAVPVTTTRAPDPVCQGRQSWVHTPQANDTMSRNQLFGVRTSPHAGCDRIVFDVRGTTGIVGYNVAYVPDVLTQGKGDKVPVEGQADMQVTILAPTTQNWKASGTLYHPSGQAVREIKYAGTQEGRTTFAVGIIHQGLAFRVSQSVSGGVTHVSLDIVQPQ